MKCRSILNFLQLQRLLLFFDACLTIRRKCFTRIGNLLCGALTVSNRYLCSVFVGMLLAGSFHPLQASPGDLDPTFGAAGKVLTDFGSPNASHDVVLQSSGKIVVGGTQLTRYNVDGTLDSTFGDNGFVTTEYASDVAIQSDDKIVIAISGTTYQLVAARVDADGDSSEYFSVIACPTSEGCTTEANAVAIQPDGKIIVAGGLLDYDLNWNFVVARFNDDLSIDTTFDHNGIAITDLGSSDTALAVTVQTDGKIVAAGNTASDVAVVRYNPDGSLDTTFNITGWVATDIGGYEEAYSVKIQPNSRIVVAGRTGNDFAIVRYKTDGQLDESFDLDGIVVKDIQEASFDRAGAVSVQSDGKIVAAGQSFTGVAEQSNCSFALVRYHIDGSLDNEFGIGGIVTTDFATTLPFNRSHDAAHGMVIQIDGKIIVTGVIDFGQSFESGDIALARYKLNGDLDTSFGMGGLVTTDTPGNDIARAVTIQSDGRIITAGSASFSGVFDFALARYNSDGSPDTAFGVAGEITTDLTSFGMSFGENSQDDIAAIALESDGKIVVAGSSGLSDPFFPVLPTSTDFAVARYNINGSLDPDFGWDGVVLTDFSGTSSFDSSRDAAFAVIIQSDGKIIASGASQQEETFTSGEVVIHSDFAMVRYNADGSLDTAFGAEGFVTTDFSAFSNDQINAMAVQSDGKVVVAGSTEIPFVSQDFGLACYNFDGSLDVTFGDYGLVTTDFNGGLDTANDLVVQSDGKIIVVGSSRAATGGFEEYVALARYEMDGSIDNSFGYNGQVMTNFANNASDRAHSVAVQLDGKIVVAVLSPLGANLDFVVARYHRDGSLDLSFGTAGLVTTDFGKMQHDQANAIVVHSNKIVTVGNSGGDFAVARYEADVNSKAAIEILITTVEACNLSQGLTNSLNKKLVDAEKALSDNNLRNDVVAAIKLLDFIKQVNAQREKKINGQLAERLIAVAENILVLLD